MRTGWEEFVRSVITDAVTDAHRAKERYNHLRKRRGFQAAHDQFDGYASDRVVRYLLLTELVNIIET